MASRLLVLNCSCCSPAWNGDGVAWCWFFCACF